MSRGRPMGPRASRQCERCGTSFEVIPSSSQRFCGKSCSNKATAQQRGESRKTEFRYKPPVCPCGTEIQPPPGLKYVYENSKKYCSVGCRQQYGKKKQIDPSKYITFECQNCGEATTRYRHQGSHKYCSNECAKRHTKTRRNIVIREGDTVLDSSWEALVFGLCSFVKLPCDRFDRENGVEWQTGAWYAPDFIMPTIGVALEVKGQQDPEDHLKWAAYREQYGQLAVIDRAEMDTLRLAASSSIVLTAQIREIASRQAEG